MSSKNASTFGPLTIRQQFLNIRSYEHTKTHNNRLNLLYDELCDIFISYYSTIQEKKTSMKKQASVNSNSKETQHFRFIQQLQSFNVELGQIMMEISGFQIGCLQNLKISNRPVFDNLNEVSTAVSQNKSLQHQITLIVKKIEPIFKQIKINFNNYKKGDENPECYYDQIYSYNCNKSLIEKINEGSILAKQIYQKKQVIQQKIGLFDGTLMKFKCKLIQNKYSVRKAIFNFTEKMKYSFVQMIELLKQCTTSHKIDFLKQLQEKNDDILQLQSQLRVENELQHPIDQSLRWKKAIQKSLSIYLRQVQLVEEVIDGLCFIFKNSKQMHQIKKDRFKEVIEQICQYYAPVETPRQQMEELFSISDNLKKKFSIILQRLTSIRDTVIKNKIHTSKHSQIIISLIKMKIKNNQSFFDKRNRKDLEELIKELSFSQIKTYILSFFECCIMNQNQLEDTLVGLGRPRRKTLDSMQISHSTISKKYSVDRKKPLTEQLWLWRDFRQQSNPIQKQYLQYLDKISLYIQKSNDRFKIKDDIQLQRYTCSLGKRNVDGQLLLMNNKLEFRAKDMLLNIQWKEIVSIQEQSNFFNKAIRIITSQGKLLFTNFKADISSIITSLKQIQEKPKANSTVTLIRKKEIILTPQQIKNIEARKEKIQKDLPKLDTFKLIVEQTFPEERIDEIYQLIYSDKPFDFYGRQQPCFFSYTGKKGGNFNWVAERYDKKGPQFYTLQQGITFQNCPISSHRKITYNHPMKPSAIPFMPKQSKNEDNRYIYWISHEQLQYQIKSTVFQVPFADTFYVQLVHKISKVENGVKIQIYSQIVFVKDTSFKSAIFKSSDPEIDENMIGFMGQIRKLLKLRQQAAKGVKIPLQTNIPIENNPQTQKSGNEVEKLKLYNKILIGILILLIFTNILHFF